MLPGGAALAIATQVNRSSRVSIAVTTRLWPITAGKQICHPGQQSCSDVDPLDMMHHVTILCRKAIMDGKAGGQPFAAVQQDP